MLVLPIIGLLLRVYPGYCYEADVADPFSYNTREPRPNRNYNNNPSQHSNYNYEPSQISSYNYGTSQNRNLNRDPSSYNYGTSQNGNFNNDPNQSSNYNYGPGQISSYNHDPSQNRNFNNDPSQSSNYNYGHSQVSSYNHDPSQNSNFNDDSIYVRPQAGGQIGGTPVPEFTEYPKVIPDTKSYPHQKKYFITQGNRQFASGQIGGTPVPEFTEYPKVLSDTRIHPYHENITQGFGQSGRAVIGGTLVPEFTEYQKILLDRERYPDHIQERVSIGGESVPEFAENQTNFLDTKRDPHNEKLVGNRQSDPGTPETVDTDRQTLERQRFLLQVSMFSKAVSPHRRLCGGTLVTSSAAISSALWFWNDGPEPAASFAVGAGEIAPSQELRYEGYQYQINVRDIKIPPRYRGAASNFQDDLAVVVLARPLPPALKPACVSFDWQLDEQQLAEGNEGTVLDLELRVQRVPYVGPEECLRSTPNDQLEYITSDKICVGLPATSPGCTFDTGSGLVYQDSHSIPYLRGVAMSSLRIPCTKIFTHVGTHRAFLLRHVSGLEAECARHYPGAGGAVKNTGGGNEFVCNCYC